MRDIGPIVIFDTECVLCCGMVAFILRHERAPTLRFASAWSTEGLVLAARYGITRAALDDTFVVVECNRGRVRSDAGLAIAAHLRAPWRWLTLLRIVPRPLRDAAYGLVARNRYRWFGRRAECIVVPPGQRDRFIGIDARRSASG